MQKRSPSSPIRRHQLLRRRDFILKSTMGLGGAALANLIHPLNSFAQKNLPHPLGYKGIPGLPHFAPKAKRIIFLFQAGGPSQMDLFDYKPLLNKWNGKDIPASIRGQQRLSGMTSSQGKFPIAGSLFSFKQHGSSGAWMSELMPYTAEIVDDLCFVHSMHTNAINHDPAVTFLQTGSEQTGRPCFGSWLSYGLGSINENLPAFVVLISRGNRIQTTLKSTLWSNGFLPVQHQGVQFRSGEDPVLYLQNPEGINSSDRRRSMDFINAMNRLEQEESSDPETDAKIAQYEMAFKMQTSVPKVMDISKEPDHILDMYGPDVKVPGTYASNCLLARRLAEQDVRFIQLYHMGWDHHFDLPPRLRDSSLQTDQPSAALIKDLKQRGLLEDTLVIWGGEFGRTAFSQGSLSANNYGRDHHPRCFSIWMAGGGIKAGIQYGQTDDFGYNIQKDPVHVHDLQATILHQLGIDHERLNFKHQGRRYRLTDVHGKLIKGLIA